MNKAIDLSLIEVVKYHHWCGVYPDCYRVHGEYIRGNWTKKKLIDLIKGDTGALLEQGYTVAWKVTDDDKTLMCAIDTKMFGQR
jgi:hypothetical protein